MKVDMHNHTYLCNHADGKPEEYLKAAILKGIDIFGFSDHAPMNFDKAYRMSFSQMDFYENLDAKYQKLVILAANSKSAHEVDKIISKKIFRDTTSIGMLEIVEEIEKKTPPEEIVKKLGMKELFNFFNSMSKKPDAIILACTHFPYMKDEFKKLTDIEILDPAEDMIKRLKSA